MTPCKLLVPTKCSLVRKKSFLNLMNCFEIHSYLSEHRNLDYLVLSTNLVKIFLITSFWSFMKSLSRMIFRLELLWWGVVIVE